MSDFYRTRMGHTFYNKNVPELVEQLARLADLLERLVVQLEKKDSDADA
jgi:hypothetical protein